MRVVCPSMYPSVPAGAPRDPTPVPVPKEPRRPRGTGRARQTRAHVCGGEGLREWDGTTETGCLAEALPAPRPDI